MNIGSPEFLNMIVLGFLFCILMKVTGINKNQRGTVTIKAISNKRKIPLLTDIAIIMVVTLLLITSSGCTTKDPTTIINNNATQISVEKASNSPTASEQTATEASGEKVTLSGELSGETRSAEEETQTITRTTKPDIEIIHPVTRTNWLENIGGTAKNIPDGYELWILVYSQEKQQYYPYTKVVPKYDEWVIPVTIGFKDDEDKEFDIVAVLADKKAQDRFNDYLVTVEENEANIYSQGIYLIPDGAKEYSRVTLTRRWSYDDNTI